jgi:hypothetical protein
MATKFRLCDEDREKFGGPEWVTLDIKVLDDLPLSVLRPIEEQVKAFCDNKSLLVVLAYELGGGTMLGKAVATWVARQLEGHAEPALDKFDVKPRKIELEEVKPNGVTDPPSPESSETSSAPEEPSKKRSTR